MLSNIAEYVFALPRRRVQLDRPSRILLTSTSHSALLAALLLSSGCGGSSFEESIDDHSKAITSEPTGENSQGLATPPPASANAGANDPQTAAATSEALALPPPVPGTWASLPANPVDVGATAMMLLTDGSVIAESAGSDQHQWTRLVPDAFGNYTTGTWTNIASSLHARLYYPSFVLKDGRVWVGGGEFIQDADQNMNATEIYDPVANTWTAGPPGLLGDIGDTPSAMLADGRIILGHRFSASTQIYNPATNTFSTSANVRVSSSSEAGWQLLADGSVFDTMLSAERYLPSQNQWIAAAQAPIAFSTQGEMGPLVYLPDGRVFVASDTNPTAYFTPPSTLTGLGSWTVGPSLPNGDFAADVPAATEPDGKVLIAGTQGQFGSATFYELDTSNNTYTTVPSQQLPIVPGFTMRLLMLPNGQIMLMNGGQGWFVYTPAGTPQAAWRPTVSSVSANADGSFTLTGTQLNGRSWGAVYGDDSMMNTNFPVVSLKDGAGHVFYARSFNFSTMGLFTGTTPVTCQFRLPAGIPSGSYSLFVSANGISSATAFPFTVGASNPDRTEGGTVSATGTACNTTTETPPKAYDNLMTSTNFTKWCVTSAPTASVPISTMYDFAGTTAFAINKYTITTGNDDGTRDPRDWTFQGCSGSCSAGSTTGWVTLDSRTGQFAGAARFQTNTYTFTNVNAFQQYRLRITANNGSATRLQITEIQMFDSACAPETDAAFCSRLGKNCGSVTDNDNCGNSRTVSSCGSCVSPNTCGGGGTPNVCGAGTTTDRTEGGTVSATGTACNTTTETPPKAYDNLMTSANFSKWCVTSAPTATVPISTVYDFAGTTAFAVTRYTITTGNDDATRDPRDWTFQACQGSCAPASNTGWITLDSRTGQFAGAARFQTNSYTVTNTTAFQQYRLRFTANNGNTTRFQLTEIQMF